MAKKAVEPIMSEDAERFMAFAGVIQWAYAVVEQGKRIEAAVREGSGREAATAQSRCDAKFRPSAICS